MHVSTILYLHHGYRRIDLWRKGKGNSIFIGHDANTHSFLDIGGGHFIGKADHKLGELLQVDDVPDGEGRLAYGISASRCVCMYAYMHKWMYGCMFVCMHVCLHVVSMSLLSIFFPGSSLNDFGAASHLDTSMKTYIPLYLH